VPHQDRVNIAVFIDFDNIEIGVKTTLGEHFDIGTILEALKERGEVVTKIAYADWTRAGEYSRALTQHAIRLVQRNLTPGGDKNGADINLALDALEMAFTHPHINAYVIVGGDSDFLSLVEKLKQYDKKVFVVGGRAFTSTILQRNCHEFIAYENLVRRPAVRGRPAVVGSTAPIAQAFPIVRRALKILADREVSPQTGLLKSTLLQLDSTFSERNYGASSFLDFAGKLAQAGLVQLKHSGRSVMVELNPGAGDEGDGSVRTETAAAVVRTDGESAEPAAADGPPAIDEAPRTERESPASTGFPEAPAAPIAPAGTQADGVQLAGHIVTAASNARWPMYLRNVKQLLRAASFDERRYGFVGLMDLLRACQRENFVRMERDRRGGLRVFQGTAARPVAPPAQHPPTPSPTIESVDAVVAPEADEPDVIEVQPVAVVDTTAELLGRAKPKRPRARPLLSAPGGGPGAGARGASAQRRSKGRGGARGGAKPGRAADDTSDEAGNR
jgi:uncharacterized LabA/DUF88 family protein